MKSLKTALLILFKEILSSKNYGKEIIQSTASISGFIKRIYTIFK